MDELNFSGTDGIDVFYRRWLPSGAARRAVLIAHGMSEHSQRYARVAEILRADGYAVYALDHRGHGRTAAATGAGRMGDAGPDGLLSDLDRLADLAIADVDSEPPVLLGHSMGALIALAYAERHGARLAGLVLSGSSGADDGVRELAEGLRGAADSGLADEPLNGLSAYASGSEPARTAYDWLSRDEAEVDLYIADELCGDDMPMTYGFLAGLLELVVAEITPEAIASLPSSLPVLLLTGAADPVSNSAANVRALESRLRDAGLTVDAIYYADARHEVFNEVNRDEVHADLVTWLEKIPSAG